MRDYTLSAKELLELKRYHKECKRRTDADRVKAVYLLGKGWSITEVCEALLLEDDAIRKYFTLYKDGGLKKLLNHNYFGRVSYLTEKELTILEMHLREHTYKTVIEIIEYVRNEFDVEYSDSGMRGVLEHLKFVYKKPEKIPFRVDLEAQKKFIKVYRSLKKKLKKEDGLYFMDATHPEHTAIPSHGWIKRGETKVLKSNPRPYRLNINGAINIKNLDMVVKFEKKINKETTLDFLEALRKHQPNGWIYVLCDNAGYYQAPEVKLYAQSMAIKLIYLPPYSPNLNLLERVWKFFKKKILYNRHYDEFSEMVEASRRFFQGITLYRDELQTLLTENFQVFST